MLFTLIKCLVCSSCFVLISGRALSSGTLRSTIPWSIVRVAASTLVVTYSISIGSIGASSILDGSVQSGSYSSICSYLTLAVEFPVTVGDPLPSLSLRFEPSFKCLSVLKLIISLD